MKFLVGIVLISSLVFSNNWIKVAHRYGGENLYYQKDSFIKIANGILEGWTSSTYSNKSIIERKSRINCNNKTISYGITVSHYPNGGEQRFNFAKHGWVFFSPNDSGESKLIETICKQSKK